MVDLAARYFSNSSFESVTLYVKVPLILSSYVNGQI